VYLFHWGISLETFTSKKNLNCSQRNLLNFDVERIAGSEIAFKSHHTNDVNNGVDHDVVER
jgi:hypothetical protein